MADFNGISPDVYRGPLSAAITPVVSVHRVHRSKFVTLKGQLIIRKVRSSNRRLMKRLFLEMSLLIGFLRSYDHLLVRFFSDIAKKPKISCSGVNFSLQRTAQTGSNHNGKRSSGAQLSKRTSTLKPLV